MIIYYDGVCNLCFGFVSIVNRFAKSGTFLFQPLQESEYKATTASFDTVIVKTMEGKLLYKADAVRFILKNMPLPFRFLNFFISIFPIRFQNTIYDYIARNRYQWFGKSVTCRLPK